MKPPAPKVLSDRLAQLSLLFLLGGAYWTTLLPDMGIFADVVKFQFVGYFLGTPHATGYPLYMVLSWIFTHLFPLGTLAFKMNLLSSLSAIACGWVLYKFLRLLGRSPLLSLVGALCFGLSPLFWSQAIIAEVYTLHHFFVISVLYLLVRWYQDQQDKHFYAACAVYALSFGHHLTMITLLPAWVYIVLVTRPKILFEPKRILRVLGLIALGALQYSYFFWRIADPRTRFMEMQTPDLETLWWYVTGAQFKGRMFSFGLSEVLTERLSLFAEVLWAQLGLFSFFALLGVVFMKDRKLLGFLLISFLGMLIFALQYDIPDIPYYFMPMVMLSSVFLCRGLEKIMEWGKVKGWLQLVALSIPLSFLLVSYPLVDRSEDMRSRDRIEKVLKLTGEQALIIATDYNASHQLRYVLYTEDRSNSAQRYTLEFTEMESDEPVKAYLKSDQPLWLPYERLHVPPGLRVYAFGASAQKRFSDEGYKLIPLSEELYLVEIAQS